MAKSSSSRTSKANQPNREELLQLAIRTAKSGNKEGARVMLRQVLSEDRYNERAMMWMAKIASTKSERRQWLERALEVNPNNDQAKAALKKMVYKTSARENRTLLIYGMVAGVLIVLLVVAFIALSLTSG